MTHEYIAVEHAFDAELRQAQADFDLYLQSRPGLVNPELPAALEPGVDVLAAQDGQDITRSFEVPVIIRPRQSKPDRIGMMLDDVRDNAIHDRPPYTAIHEGPEAALFTSRLLPVEAVNAIRRIGQHYAVGTMSRRIDQVGKKDKGTYHPHFYFIDRTKPRTTRMYFVDPEHKVASNSVLRPSIANLVGIEVPDDESASPQVAILRYQIPKYDPNNKPEGLGHNDLREVIEEVLNNGGKLPDLLTGDAERGVLFMMAGDNETSLAQGRYSSKKQIDNFVKGGEGSSALEGKVHVQAAVLNKLIRLFNQPAQARMVGKVTLSDSQPA